MVDYIEYFIRSIKFNQFTALDQPPRVFDHNSVQLELTLSNTTFFFFRETPYLQFESYVLTVNRL